MKNKEGERRGLVNFLPLKRRTEGGLCKKGGLIWEGALIEEVLLYLFSLTLLNQLLTGLEIFLSRSLEKDTSALYFV